MLREIPMSEPFGLVIVLIIFERVDWVAKNRVQN